MGVLEVWVPDKGEPYRLCLEATGRKPEWSREEKGRVGQGRAQSSPGHGVGRVAAKR